MTRPGADQKYAHGTRARYVFAKCRCARCRDANREYTRAFRDAADAATDFSIQSKTGDPCPGVFDQPCRWSARLYRTSKGGLCSNCRRRLGNVFVDAAPVRRHLIALAGKGIGQTSVAAASDINNTTIAKVRTGKIRRVRPENAARLLEIDTGAASDGSRVDGRRTWQAIDRMVRLGLTHVEISLRLGYSPKAKGIPIRRKRVSARNEMRVLRLLREVEAEVERDRAMPKLCPGCAMSHAQADRVELVARLFRRLDEPVFADAHEAYPCIYPMSNAGERLYHRDRAVVLAAAETRRAA